MTKRKLNAGVEAAAYLLCWLRRCRWLWLSGTCCTSAKAKRAQAADAGTALPEAASFIWRSLRRRSAPRKLAPAESSHDRAAPKRTIGRKRPFLHPRVWTGSNIDLDVQTSICCIKYKLHLFIRNQHNS